MSAHFTLGIEEEFQIVDRRTGQLTPSILAILEKGASQFGDKIKPEMLQSTVEIVTDVCPNINAARLELQSLHTRLLRLLEEEGLTIISAGTHPTASWPDQPSTPDERYIELEEELQDVVRSLLIFGLHVHVGVESNEIAIVLMNQLRTWIPHLLALSANSPFWCGRFTGLKSYRSIVWRPLPRNGVSEVFATWSAYDAYVQSLIRAGCIDNAKKIWWDIRPHPFFNTIEFRICDMPATLEDTIALAALIQATVAKLYKLHTANQGFRLYRRALLMENKWRAARYGMNGKMIDFGKQTEVPAKDLIHEYLEFVDDVVDELDSREELNYIHTMLETGSGADRQLQVYQDTGDLKKVVDYIIEETEAGLAEDEPAAARKVG